MAKVKITIEDRPGGHVAVSVIVDPPMPRSSIPDPSAAQQLGLHIADRAFRELAKVGRINLVNASDEDGPAILDWIPKGDEPS